MGAIRGTVDDYERWVAEFGCAGWGWPEMLATFLSVEDDVDYGGDGLHGRGGPIPLARVPLDEFAPLDAALRAAIDRSRLPDLRRLPRSRRNRHQPVGARRCATAAAFRPTTRTSNPRGRARTSWCAATRWSTASRFAGRRAVGVRLADGDDIAAREVIMSAGAIHSPAILLRSGIGIEDRLPVGANLKDHAATPGFEVAL